MSLKASLSPSVQSKVWQSLIPRTAALFETHTHTPTDFQNKTRLFTKPENPERNLILPFKQRLKFPHRCCCLHFFISISCDIFFPFPCSFPLPQSTQCDTHSVSPHLPSSLHLRIYDVREKVLDGKRGIFWKVAGMVSAEKSRNQMLNLKTRCLACVPTSASTWRYKQINNLHRIQAQHYDRREIKKRQGWLCTKMTTHENPGNHFHVILKKNL